MRRQKFIETSHMKRYDGDIMITDPCYLVPTDYDGVWMDFPFMQKIPSIIQRDTMYGDWSCTVFRRNGRKTKIGSFCADAGMVCCCLLEEALKANPDELPHNLKNRPWCYAVIKDFHGTVKFNVFEEEYEWEGEKVKDRFLVVEGEGTKGKKNRKYDFVAYQTGL